MKTHLLTPKFYLSWLCFSNGKQISITVCSVGLSLKQLFMFRILDSSHTITYILMRCFLRSWNGNIYNWRTSECCDWCVCMRSCLVLEVLCFLIWFGSCMKGNKRLSEYRWILKITCVCWKVFNSFTHFLMSISVNYGKLHGIV